MSTIQPPPLPTPTTTTALHTSGLRKNGTRAPLPSLYPILPPTSHLTTSPKGKQWHAPRTAFRPTSGQTPYSKRIAVQKAASVTKAREREMKAEKEGERQRRIAAIREKREKKEEKARFEKMAEKMHAKRVERVRRREKRNKLLKS
ncbi:hypothetical protein G7Y79_00036g072280 [Physcia stellaris]|nr:hypothetical protein G7Y79_00036g072280 [Physcia stellaris]